MRCFPDGSDTGQRSSTGATSEENPEHEIRNSRQYQSTDAQNPRDQTVWNLKSRICLGFRAWDSGFGEHHPFDFVVALDDGNNVFLVPQLLDQEGISLIIQNNMTLVGD